MGELEVGGSNKDIFPWPTRTFTSEVPRVHFFCGAIDAAFSGAGGFSAELCSTGLC